ncbi:conserved hypothetical protein [Planktothrix serta PCC 8927]|uniref:Uncharacterized protein n=1 Tax=Planktothrix serta PCC 8927 TaxID=671068 RepID=A0A7Z9E2D2_9CYAN|nr:hypothetical protein [Planktothrix serta]VXD23818.1 conserved hypothetical protein [Planktothrix serta PCC 8927]
MLWTIQTRSKISITQVTDHIINSGQLSHGDYLRLMSAILSDKDITESERNQINRVFDYVQTGRIKFHDI